MEKNYYDELILEAKNNITYYSKKLAELRIELIKVQKEILLNKARISIDLSIDEFKNMVESYNSEDKKLLGYLFQKDELDKKLESLNNKAEVLSDLIEKEENKNSFLKLFNSSKITRLNAALESTKIEIDECSKEIKEFDVKLFKFRLNRNDLAHKIIKVCDFFSLTLEELNQVLKLDCNKEYYKELFVKEIELLKLIDETKGWIQYNQYKIEEYEIERTKNNDDNYYHSLRAQKLADSEIDDSNKKYENPGLDIRKAEKMMDYLKMDKNDLKEKFESSYTNKVNTSTNYGEDINSHVKRVEEILNHEFGNAYCDKVNPGTDINRYLRKMELLKMSIEDVIKLHSNIFSDTKVDIKQLIK